MTSAALYPGTFDPITNGHHDLIRRAARIFDRVVVAVADNINKVGLFSAAERAELLRQVVGNNPAIEVDVFSGLLVDYARRRGAASVVRGLRAVADFEFEFQLSNMNRHLDSGVETLFMMTGAGNFYVSSSLVKEVAALGGDIDGLVPAPVALALRARFPQS